MARGKSNRNQYTLTQSKPHSPNKANPGSPNTPVKHDADLKFYLMKIINYFKEDINNQLNEIQENNGK